ncbi:hypothetical protein GPA27_02035 [Aromatoleum toluolicum]|uniref:Uncharacterized protein n=1 Tax=Aromatoleum toluolicum TaxID=90060 RepID=A0ABX1NAC0_9RHOO|nr:hypothetical protein [Aromatoleum toluolicum]NMF96175.1 hypothetical protein [Aromatoleum toluolicum]
MQQTELMSTFATNLHGAATDHQTWPFACWQDENPRALALIEERIAERRDEQVADAQISSTALARYFRLLDIARVELRDVFSDEDFGLMFNTHPHPVWTGEFETTPADILYSSYGGDGMVDEGSEVYTLCVKLAQLTPLQQVALIDLLECAWRDRTVGPLRYAGGALGRGESPRSRS